MKRGRNRCRLFIIAATLAVGACGAPAIFGTDHRTAYTYGEVLRAANDRDLRVEAIGGIGSDPRVRGRQLEAIVVRALEQQGPNWIRPTYTTAATGEADPHYRLRWLFNVPPNFRNNSACSDDAATAAADWREETGVVVTAFCRTDRYLSFARGSLGEIADADSPAFASWVGSMARSVLPPRNPNRDRGRDCPRRRSCR